MGYDIRHSLVDKRKNVFLTPRLREFATMKGYRQAAVAPDFNLPRDIRRLILECSIVAVEPFGIGAGIISL